MTRAFVIVAAFAFLFPQAILALDANAQRRAERYESILATDPAQERTIERLVETYSSAGELPVLIERLRSEIPVRPDAAVTLGGIFLQTNDPDAAIQVFQEAAKTSPDDPRIQSGIARSAGQLQRYADSARAWQVAAEFSGSSPEAAAALFSAADAWLAGADPARASEMLRKASAIAPGDAGIRRRIAESAAAMGDTGVARTQLQWLSENDTPSGRIEALTRLADLYALADQLPDAIRTLETTLARLGPTHWQRPEMERKRIYLHVRNGSLTGFATVVKEEAEANPSDPSPWLRLAEVERARGRHADRVTALRKAHELASGDMGLARELAIAEADAGRNLEGIAIADAALTQNPGDAEWTFVRAELGIRAKDPDTAIRLLDSLLAANSRDEALRARIREFYETNRMLKPLERLIVAGDQDSQNNPPDLLSTFGRTPEILESMVAAASRLSEKNPSTSAAMLIRTAREFLEQNRPERALELARNAAATDPKSTEAAVLVLSIEAEKGDIPAAKSLADAFARNFPEEAEIGDHQLFQSLAKTSTARSAKDSVDAVTLVDGLMTSMRPGEIRTALVRERLAELQATAKSTGAVSDIIRIARWQVWMNLPEAATAGIALALATHSDDPVLLDFQARLAATRGDPATALQALDKLSAANPSTRDATARRRAELLLERGDLSEATATFTALAEAAPANAERWMDLASVQQRTGDWYLALDTWMRAYSLATPAQKRQIQKPILAVAERLTLYERAIDFLVSYGLEESDEAAATAGFENAIAFASKHSQIPMLTERLEKEWSSGRRTMPLLTARATLAAAQGNPERSLQLLANAAEGARDRLGAWNRLLDAAIRAGSTDHAIYAASAAARESSDPSAWIRLARTQQSMQSADTATATWQLIRHKFNRDSHALESAADFFESQGKTAQAAECRLDAAKLEGATPATIARAARVAIASGDRPEAMEQFRRILNLTPPLTISTGIWPGPSELPAVAVRQGNLIAMRALGGFADPDVQTTLRGTASPTEENSDQLLRLEAIRAIAAMSRDGTARSDWRAWCDDPARTPLEKVWGRYSVGDTDTALALIEEYADEFPKAEAEQAFIGIALAGGKLAEIRDWIDQSLDDRRRRSEFLFLALSSRFGSQPLSQSELLELLQPTKENVPESWQTAWILATHGHYASAAELASYVLPLTIPQLAATGIQSLASWYLALGDQESALRVLRTPMERSFFSLDQPVFHVLRMRWLLESEAGREVMKNEMAIHPDPIISHASKAIIGAIEGNAEGLTAETEALVAAWDLRPPPPDANESAESILQTSIMAAQTWKLPNLAMALIAATSTRREASDPSWKHDISNLRVLSLIQQSPPRLTRYHLQEASAIKFQSSDLSTMARQLDALGFPAAASEVRNELLSRSDADAGSLMEIALNARRRSDTAQERASLQRLLDLPALTGSFPTYIEAALRLAALALEGKDPALALTVLAPLHEQAPADPRITALQDVAFTELGRPEERVAIWKKQTEYQPDAAAAWLSALVDQGREAEAIRMGAEWTAAGRGLRPEALGVLARAEAIHSPNQKNVALERLVRQESWTTIASIATSLPGKAARQEAAAALRTAMTRPIPQADRVACARAWLGLATIDRATAEFISEACKPDRTNSDVGSALAAQEVEMAIVQVNPALSDWLNERLTRRSSSGPWKELAAIAWLQRLLASDPSPDAVSAAMAKIRTDRVPIQLSQTLAVDLAARGYSQEAAKVYEELYASNPDRREFLFEQAVQVWKSGAQSEAMTLVTPWLGMREFDPSIHLLAARFFEQIEQADRASELYSEIIAKDVGVSYPAAWIGLARLKSKVPEVAPLLLQAAYTNPDLRDPAPILEFLREKSGPGFGTPKDLPTRLPSSIIEAVHLSVLQDLIANDRAVDAGSWLTPALARSDAGLGTLSALARLPAAAPALQAFWTKHRTQLPDSRSLKSAHADFLLAQAERSLDSKSRAGFQLAAATEAPWRWDCVAPWVEHLRAEKREDALRPLVEALITGRASDADRAAARNFLELSARSDGLIPGGAPP